MRDEADFEINLKAEREIEAIIRYLEHQQKAIDKIDGALKAKHP
jgi:uncharacterized membrane protein